MMVFVFSSARHKAVVSHDTWECWSQRLWEAGRKSREGKKRNERQSATLHTSCHGLIKPFPSVTPSPHKNQPDLLAAGDSLNCSHGLMCYSVGYYITICLRRAQAHKRGKKIQRFYYRNSSVCPWNYRMSNVAADNATQNRSVPAFITANPPRCKSRTTPAALCCAGAFKRPAEQGKQMPRCQTSGGNMSNTAFMWCATISVLLQHQVLSSSLFLKWGKR